MNNDLYPSTYDEWRNCFQNHGNTPLTSAFLQSRLAELCDDSHAKTKEFARLYGADHLKQTIAWFRQAAAALPNE